MSNPQWNDLEDVILSICIFNLQNEKKSACVFQQIKNDDDCFLYVIPDFFGFYKIFFWFYHFILAPTSHTKCHRRHNIFVSLWNLDIKFCMSHKIWGQRSKIQKFKPFKSIWHFCLWPESFLKRPNLWFNILLSFEYFGLKGVWSERIKESTNGSNSWWEKWQVDRQSKMGA